MERVTRTEIQYNIIHLRRQGKLTIRIRFK